MAEWVPPQHIAPDGSEQLAVLLVISTADGFTSRWEGDEPSAAVRSEVSEFARQMSVEDFINAPRIGLPDLEHVDERGMLDDAWRQGESSTEHVAEIPRDGVPAYADDSRGCRPTGVRTATRWCAPGQSLCRRVEAGKVASVRGRRWQCARSRRTRGMWGSRPRTRWHAARPPHEAERVVAATDRKSRSSRPERPRRLRPQR
jgi:hypothetical protein